MRAPSRAATRDKILFHLKTKGPQSAQRLAERLGMTAMGARQHLQRLADEGMVTWSEERQKVGRPVRLWTLTERAAERFPDNHADLTVEVLAAMSSVYGDEGMQKVLAARTREQLARYRKRLPAGGTLAERVTALARIRDEEGYMASVQRKRDGSLLLVENHCPICAAARECLGLCAEELALFRSLLGESVVVERVEHAPEGARRCAYRIGAA